MGGSIGPFLAGYMYDHFGSYSRVWLFNIVLLVVISIAVLSLKTRKPF